MIEGLLLHALAVTATGKTGESMARLGITFTA